MDNNLLSLSSAKKLVLPLIIGVVLLLIIVGVLWYISTRPTQTPKGVFLSNLTDSQATLTWLTDNPSSTQVTIAEGTNSFDIPFSPFGTTYKDDKDQNLSQNYALHFVTFKNLKPDKKYHFRITEGLKTLKKGDFQTGKTLPPVPKNIITGTVLSSDAKSKISGATVYYQVSFGSSRSGLLSTITNSQGQYSFDLSSLRNLNGSKRYPIKNGFNQEVLVEAGALGRFKTSADKETKSWPTILLKASQVAQK